MEFKHIKTTEKKVYKVNDPFYNSNKTPNVITRFNGVEIMITFGGGMNGENKTIVGFIKNTTDTDIVIEDFYGNTTTYYKNFIVSIKDVDIVELEIFDSNNDLSGYAVAAVSKNADIELTKTDINKTLFSEQV